MCLSVTVSFDDCCLKHVSSLGHKVQRNVVQYTRQNVDGGCNLPAIIFITKRNRLYCANPASNWVKKLMIRVDKKRYGAKFGEKPYKG
uniref:Chemokine interleukin-8-like domain-containing protein n=1 Tax=Knipowitschia caucasica TaxID=637954 RepID=A0AAV2JXH2_KNICA